MPMNPRDPQRRIDLGLLAERLSASRQLSLDLARPLSAEDQVVQASADASPTKWHLGHTTWFYESFLLRPHLPDYRPFDETFAYCFNSYYETMGTRHPRNLRGLLTRPTAEEVRDYRAYVDDGLAELVRVLRNGASDGDAARIAGIIELGIHHEQQHQELLLTDILCLFASQPLRPAYLPPPNEMSPPASREAPTPSWCTFDVADGEIGHAGGSFHFDHEGPRHRVALRPYRLATRLVTNGEWLDFIADGGYANPLLWLADGWATVKAEGWTAPGYWEKRDDAWHQMTLRGLLAVDPRVPVAHVSYFEADAFARWAGKRLPNEAEWEVAAASLPASGNMLGTGALRPRAASAAGDGEPRLTQVFGDVWEWTASVFQSYPGYRPPAGAIGEYNGKFMISQQVLRGASCVTPDGHSRATYRNFFYPHQRWQFTGLRLAEDAA